MSKCARVGHISPRPNSRFEITSLGEKFAQNFETKISKSKSKITHVKINSSKSRKWLNFEAFFAKIQKNWSHHVYFSYFLAFVFSHAFWLFWLKICPKFWPKNTQILASWPPSLIISRSWSPPGPGRSFLDPPRRSNLPPQVTNLDRSDRTCPKWPQFLKSPPKKAEGFLGQKWPFLVILVWLNLTKN